MYAAKHPAVHRTALDNGELFSPMLTIEKCPKVKVSGSFVCWRRERVILICSLVVSEAGGCTEKKLSVIKRKPEKKMCAPLSRAL